MAEPPFIILRYTFDSITFYFQYQQFSKLFLQTTHMTIITFAWNIVVLQNSRLHDTVFWTTTRREPYLRTNYVYQLALLSLIGLAGTIISTMIPIGIPPSILGMVILLILLIARVIRLYHIKDVAHVFLAYMGLLFIPPVVDLVDQFGLLGNQVFQFIVISVLSTIFTFLGALGSAALVMAIQNRHTTKEVEHD